MILSFYNLRVYQCCSCRSPLAYPTRLVQPRLVEISIASLQTIYLCLYCVLEHRVVFPFWQQQKFRCTATSFFKQQDSNRCKDCYTKMYFLLFQMRFKHRQQLSHHQWTLIRMLYLRSTRCSSVRSLHRVAHTVAPPFGFHRNNSHSNNLPNEGHLLLPLTAVQDQR